MSFAALLAHPVLVHNPVEGDTDRYGDEVEEFDDGTPEDAMIQQLSADEDLRDRDTRVTKYRAFFPIDSVVTALSIVVWDAVPHRVDGEPARLDYGSVPHIEAALERIEG